MIIERLARLARPKRILAAVLAVLAIACVCYYVIAGDLVVKLRAAKAKYALLGSALAGAEGQHPDFFNLQKQLEDARKRIKEQEQKCFGSEEASQFFENINAMALAHNLRPISRIISQPKAIFVDEKTEAEEHFLETQSAKVAVAGSYFDIVDFVNALMDRPQKVRVTNLHIALPPGEKSNPRASFSISVLISAVSTPSHKTRISTGNISVNTTVAFSSEIDRQIPGFRPTRLRNPMEFGGSKAGQDETGEIIVRGILYSEDNPSAVIGRRIVYEGDEVSGATIVKINEDSVEFEMNGKRWRQKVRRYKKSE